MLKLTTEYQTLQPAIPASPAGPAAPLLITAYLDGDINRVVVSSQVGILPARTTNYNRDECIALANFFASAAEEMSP